MELYLSRIILNPSSKAVMKDLANPRDLHRTISRWFPAITGQDDKPQHEKETPRKVYRLLHRLDRKGDSLVLYLQSTIAPDWSRMTPGYAIRHDEKAIHLLYAEIKGGTRLQFRLEANPSKRVGKNDPAAADKYKDPNKRRRVDIRKEDDRVKWLERKGEECGFAICRVSASDSTAAVATSMPPPISFQHDNGRATIAAAVFDGTLEVTDADTFRKALVNGIGPGKAYGFGLMSIAPVRPAD